MSCCSASRRRSSGRSGVNHPDGIECHLAFVKRYTAVTDIIRPAAQSDYEVVNRILEQDSAFHASLEPDWMTDLSGIAMDEFMKYLDDDDLALLVCEREDMVVGLVQLRKGTGGDPGMKHRPYGWIDEIAVEESLRGGGIGTALMDASEAWAKENGLKMLMLDVWSTNERAIGLYDRKGYSTFRQRMFKTVED